MFIRMRPFVLVSGVDIVSSSNVFCLCLEKMEEKENDDWEREGEGE